MGAWFALYLPYRFTPEYYLLPFSLGAAVLTGLLVPQVVDAAPADESGWIPLGDSLCRARRRPFPPDHPQ